MTTNTLRPNATIYNSGAWAITGGAGTAHGVTSDNSDASYATSVISNPVPMILDLGTVTLSGDAVKQVRVRARSRANTTSTTFRVDLIVDGAVTATLTATVATTITTFTGAWFVGSLTQAQIDSAYLLCIGPTSTPADEVRHLELYVDVLTADPPSAPTVYLPTGTITTSAADVRWIYVRSDTDTGAQSAFQVKVFDSATYGGGGFNADTSTALYDSGIVASNETEHTTDPVVDGTSHRAYVKTAHTVNGVLYWGMWGNATFTVSSTEPEIGNITATPDDVTGSVEVVVSRDTAGAAWDEVTVERSEDGGVTWLPVRGATECTVSNGLATFTANTFTVTDYEAPNGVGVVYRATAALAGAGGATFTPQGVVDLPGTTGNYLSTPDAAALDIVGDICIVARIAADDWTPAAGQAVASKFLTTGNQRSWHLLIATTGAPQFQWSTDGTALVTATSTANLSTLTAGSAKWLAVTLDVDNGASGNDTRFWTSDDESIWSQLGSTVTNSGVTSIFSSTAELHVGRSTGAAALFAGKVYAVSVRTGIGASGTVGGTEVFGFTPAQIPVDDSATTFTALTGQTVTINRSGAPDTVVGYDSVTWLSSNIWLKSLTDPTVNETVALQAIPDYSIAETQTQTYTVQTESTAAATSLETLLGPPRRTGIFHVLGATHPVTVADAGSTLLLQYPASYGLTDRYLTVTGYSQGFIAPNGQQTVANISLRLFNVETVTVARPADTTSA